MTTVTKKTNYYKLLIAGIIILVSIIGGITFIYKGKTNKLETDTAQRAKELKAGPVVKTVLASYNSGGKELVLIGEARPYQTTTLYAKISGYLEKINVDKGDKVTEGEQLAYIDNPEIDQQYNSALADLENKKKIAERDKKLLDKKFISQEDADLSQTAADMADANVKSLAEQQQYKNLKAPFSGTITSRFVDQGALIQNANNSQTSAQPVVTLADLGRLRIYVYAEQRDAANLKTGDSVEITLTERPDVHIKANITRIAGELDPHTRMMLCEIDVENKDNTIVPGSYVQVHIKLQVEGAVKKITIPSTALIMRNNKTMVAVINKDSTLHFREVHISNNTGEKMNISDGIQEGERIAISVGESIDEGQKVRVTE
ncbi:MAG TPA: efflux RND transporter periplasmic adaptor subunit [Bacteroidia bacterium]|nr:efflux RND transporter periplasmic adaptor subunit [Bacteroidia bacterium]